MHDREVHAHRLDIPGAMKVCRGKVSGPARRGRIVGAQLRECGGIDLPVLPTPTLPPRRRSSSRSTHGLMPGLACTIDARAVGRIDRDICWSRTRAAHIGQGCREPLAPAARDRIGQQAAGNCVAFGRSRSTAPGLPRLRRRAAPR